MSLVDGEVSEAFAIYSLVELLERFDFAFIGRGLQMFGRSVARTQEPAQDKGILIPQIVYVPQERPACAFHLLQQAEEEVGFAQLRRGVGHSEA